MFTTPQMFQTQVTRTSLSQSAMTSSSDLTVIICHGCYHSPAPYLPLIDALKAEGIDAYCPQLPTSDLARLNVGDVHRPNFDLGPPPEGYPQGEQDTEVILSILESLVEEQGKKVILLGHSAGGWTATQAAKKELHVKERAKQELAGGIIGILYVGAFIIPVGESIHSFFQPKDGTAVVPPFMTFHVSHCQTVNPILLTMSARNMARKDLGQWWSRINISSTT
jgi:pimeloyl-ACP methyl ester carboxylesterase